MKTFLKIFLFFILLVPQYVFAHSGHGIFNGFYSGFLHPLSGLDHILAMMAVGMLAFRYNEKPFWIFPLIFISFMTLASASSTLMGNIFFIDLLLAASVFILGFMLLKKELPSFKLQSMLIALFACFHGYAHGAEIPANDNGLLYSLGFILSTSMLHYLGIYFSELIKANDKFLKTCGAAIALAGIMMIGHVF